MSTATLNKWYDLDGQAISGAELTHIDEYTKEYQGKVYELAIPVDNSFFSFVLIPKK